MTKCTVIGDKTTAPDKPIEFTKWIGRDGRGSACEKPRAYKHIELIARDWAYNEDLMYAYNSNRTYGLLYLGHWNGGYVE